MSVGSIMAGAAYVRLSADDARLAQGLANAKTKMAQFAASVNAWSNKMSMVGLAAAYPVAMVTKSYADFDDKMRMVQAVTGATGKAYEKLTEQSKRLGRETSFTASQVAEGMLSLGRMGLNPKEIEAAIKPMMNLARVTDTDLGEAAMIAANNLRVFNLEAGQMSYVSDILSVTANSSAQTLTDLGEALKMAGPHAYRAGADLKETAACLGILANMGIRGSLAGTALGKSYKRLADPKIIEYLKQYGVETLNADGSMRRMRDTLVDIAKAMKNMTNAEQIMFAEKVFDARGSLGGGTLSVNTDAIDVLMDKLNNSNGAAENAANTMEEGLGGSLRRIASAAEGVGIALGEAFAFSFLPVIESAAEFCLWLREIIGANAELVGGLAQFAAATVSFGILIKAATAVYSAVAGILAPIKAVILYLDKVVSGSAAAAQAQAAASAAAAAQAAQQEKLKELAQTRSDAIRIASEKRRNMVALQGVAAEAQATVAAEAKKLAATKARVAQEAALNSAAKKAYIAQNGSAAGFRQLETYAAAKAALKQQETALAASVAAQKQAVAAANAARTATLQAAAAAKTASVAYYAEANVANFSSRRTIVYGATLGKLNTVKLFSAALSKKHAATVLAASISEMVAAKRAAGASAMRTAGYYAEAVGAKIAAAATLLLSKALAVISAHPVMFALIALCAAFLAVKAAIDASADAAEAECSIAEDRAQAAADERQKLEEQIQKEKEQVKTLENLNKQEQLSQEQMLQAQTIVESLTDKYGDLGLEYDKTTGKVNGLRDATEKLNAEQQKQLRSSLENEAQEAKKLFEAKLSGMIPFHGLPSLLPSAKDDVMLEMGFKKESGDFYFSKSWTPDLEDLNSALLMAEKNNLAEYAKRIREIIDALNNYEAKMKEIQNLDKKITVEVEFKKENPPEFNYSADGKTYIGESGLEEAERDLDKLKAELHGREMSRLEEELRMIDKKEKKYQDMLYEAYFSAHKNYKFHIEWLFDYAKGYGVDAKDFRSFHSKMVRHKEELEAEGLELDEDDKKYFEMYEKMEKFADMQDRLSADLQALREKGTTAREKAREAERERNRPYTDFLSDQEKEDQKKLQEQSFKSMLDEGKFQEAEAAAAALFDMQKAALDAAKKKYEELLKKAQEAGSDGGTGISTAEGAELKSVQDDIKNAKAEMDRAQKKIDEARAAAESAAKTETRTKENLVASWSLADLYGKLNIPAMDRAADAAERSLEEQKKMNDLLDDIRRNSSDDTGLAWA